MQAVSEQLQWGMPLYNLLYVSFIIFFCYFYTAIVFNPDDVAENMRKYGGFVPGIRPGKRTAEYLDHILGRITFGGAHLPRPGGHPPRVPDHRLQGGAHPRDRAGPRHVPLEQQPGLDHGRPAPELLLRRDLAPHRGGGGHGHRGPGRGPARSCATTKASAEREGAGSVAAARPQGDHAPEGPHHLPRPPGGGEGHAGRAPGGVAGCAPDLDRGHAPRAHRAGDADREGRRGRSWSRGSSCRTSCSSP